MECPEGMCVSRISTSISFIIIPVTCLHSEIPRGVRKTYTTHAHDVEDERKGRIYMWWWRPLMYGKSKNGQRN